MFFHVFSPTKLIDSQRLRKLLEALETPVGYADATAHAEVIDLNVAVPLTDLTEELLELTPPQLQPDSVAYMCLGASWGCVAVSQMAAVSKPFTLRNC